VDFCSGCTSLKLCLYPKKLKNIILEQINKEGDKKCNIF